MTSIVGLRKKSRRRPSPAPEIAETLPHDPDDKDVHDNLKLRKQALIDAGVERRVVDGQISRGGRALNALCFATSNG